MKKRWNVTDPEEDSGEAVRAIERDLGVLPTTARLLVGRGLADPAEALAFFRPDLRSLHDPFSMKDMDRAAERLARAIRDGERIAVYGDYDVDGTTASALLYLFFSEIGVEPLCYIPERMEDGYGLNRRALKRLADDGAGVVVTVDCGSSDHDEADYARSLGLDVIVTDHHEIPAQGPPPALAVLNPKRPDCAFPFKDLAGVGVAFNLAMALRAVLREEHWYTGGEPNLKKHLDLVAVGTVADVVPLVGENRVLVSYGLRELAGTTKPGLRALKEVCALNGGVSATRVAFQLAPRINAAGRLSRADKALKLLVSQSAGEAAVLAEELDRENTRRQKVEVKILDEAAAMAEEMAEDRTLVLAGEGWHAGVIGIVASRLVERFAKPVVMIALDGDVGRGSARGVRSMSILDGITHCAEDLERFGGHRAAAGLTVSREKLEDFRRKFTAYLNSTLTDDDLIPELDLDAMVSLDEVTPRLVSEISRLEPFGCANREPLLGLTGAEITDSGVVGSGHLKLNVGQRGRVTRAIGFGLGSHHPLEGPGWSVAFSPFMDEWRGNRSLKLRVKDIRPDGAADGRD